jgi:serine/threonine-protein kinase
MRDEQQDDRNEERAAAEESSGAEPSTRPRSVVRRRFDRALRLLLVGGALAVTLGLSFGIGAYLTLRAAVTVPEVAVPELVDRDVVEAQALLSDLGLDPQVAGRRFAPDAPEGKVLEQFPPPGTSTKPGRPVRLVVSLGQAKAMVPALSGSSLRRAQLALRGRDLGLQAVGSVHHPEVDLGRVLAQHPPAETEGFPGDDVSLLLSAGPEPRAYVMPQLVGRTLGMVRHALQQVGFRRIRVQSVGAGDPPPGSRVIAQLPEPGFRVTVDERIVIKVVPGVGEEEMP